MIVSTYRRDSYAILDDDVGPQQTERMAAAILIGATSGAVHAVTGPDHLLSLGSQAMNGAKRAFHVGLAWGLGHGIGTLLLAIPVVLLSRSSDLDFLTAYSERIAGVALMLTALWTLQRARRIQNEEAADPRAPIAVGLFHGMTGAGALVLMLPAIVNTNASFAVVFLLAFALGSTLAMAALTAVLGLIGQRLLRSAGLTLQRVITVAAFTLGAIWTFGS